MYRWHSAVSIGMLFFPSQATAVFCLCLDQTAREKKIHRSVKEYFSNHMFNILYVTTLILISKQAPVTLLHVGLRKSLQHITLIHWLMFDPSFTWLEIRSSLTCFSAHSRFLPESLEYILFSPATFLLFSSFPLLSSLCNYIKQYEVNTQI